MKTELVDIYLVQDGRVAEYTTKNKRRRNIYIYIKIEVRLSVLGEIGKVYPCPYVGISLVFSSLSQVWQTKTGRYLFSLFLYVCVCVVLCFVFGGK